MEKWKDIAGFDGVYKVSDFGRVASYDRVLADGRRRKGRILREWCGKGGQPVVDLMVDGKRSRFLVARLVAEAFVRPLVEGDEVLHLDLNKKNNAATNLAPMPHQDVVAYTNKVLCSFEYVPRENMTMEMARDHFDYCDGQLTWKRRPHLRVSIGEVAGFLQEGHYRVHFCGNTYMKNQIVWLWHTGSVPDHVLPKNGNYLDSRIENLYECSASQWATISDRVANFCTPPTQPDAEVG